MSVFLIPSVTSFRKNFLTISLGVTSLRITFSQFQFISETVTYLDEFPAADVDVVGSAYSWVGALRTTKENNNV